jgi:hypothetical protein
MANELEKSFSHHDARHFCNRLDDLFAFISSSRLVARLTLFSLTAEGNEQIIKDNENILPRAALSVVVKIFFISRQLALVPQTS